jgi:hypothetical protein
MQFIFMPFSNPLSGIPIYEYPNSLFLTFFINVASVLAIPAPFDTIFVFNIYEAVFDGLKFGLKQPLKLFGVCDVQDSI